MVERKSSTTAGTAHAWLFISSLINHRLTGDFTTDITMAGTSQMLDIQQRDFSRKFYKPPVFHADSSLVGGSG
ncbi:FGGY family carbohydrate kinase [Escherichia coli]